MRRQSSLVVHPWCAAWRERSSTRGFALLLELGGLQVAGAWPVHSKQQGLNVLKPKTKAGMPRRLAKVLNSFDRPDFSAIGPSAR